VDPTPSAKAVRSPTSAPIDGMDGRDRVLHGRDPGLADLHVLEVAPGELGGVDAGTDSGLPLRGSPVVPAADVGPDSSLVDEVDRGPSLQCRTDASRAGEERS
jgi:hypothetical protein